MWSEKYGALTPDQIRDHRIRQLVNTVDEKPPLLFVGPSGIGKTETALCIAEQWLDKNRTTLEGKLPISFYFDLISHELLASYESAGRRDRSLIVPVTDIVALMKIITSRKHEKLFMIVVIDEADKMTNDDQTELIKIIKDSPKKTHFIIICGSLSSMIEPLWSKCMIFRFTKLTMEDAVRHLTSICQKEKVRFDEKALTEIYEAALGNLRDSINILQAAASMGSVSYSNVKASIELSVRSKIGEVIRLALAGKFSSAMPILPEYVYKRVSSS
jgi:replication factor C small subunit